MPLDAATDDNVGNRGDTRYLPANPVCYNRAGATIERVNLVVAAMAFSIARNHARRCDEPSLRIGCRSDQHLLHRGRCLTGRISCGRASGEDRNLRREYARPSAACACYGVFPFYLRTQ